MPDTTGHEKKKADEAPASTRAVSIKTGLMLVSGSILLLLVGVSLVAWLLYNTLETAIDRVVGETLPTVVESRNLAMASKGLSTLATEMILVPDTDELAYKTRFASMVSVRLEAALNQALEALPENRIIPNLLQLHNQVTSGLVELSDSVGKRLVFVRNEEAFVASLKSMFDTFSHLLFQELKQRSNADPSPESAEGSETFDSYLELYSLITRAESLILNLRDVTYLYEAENQHKSFQGIVQRFRNVSRHLDKDALFPAMERILGKLEKACNGDENLFKNHMYVLQTRAQESSLNISINRLAAQFELLTTTLVEQSNAQAEEVNANAARQVARAKLLILLLLVFSLAATLILIRFYGGRRLAEPLMDLVQTVRTIEKGNLYVRVQVKGAAEIQELGRAFNRMTSRLSRRDRELSETQALLNSVLDALPSILIAADERRQVLLWNHEASRFFGKEQEAVVGRELDKALLPFAIEREVVERVMAVNLPEIIKNVPVTSGTERLVFDIVVFPLHYGGLKGTVLRIDDVTEKNRIEEIMVQSEKMLSVGGLAAGMAHEINNPLAGILQNAQVLENRLAGDLPVNYRIAEASGLPFDGIRTYMEKRGVFSLLSSIRDAGMRAADIVENMLSFARKGVRSHSTHDLGELLDKTISLAENDYDLKKHFDFRRIRIVREYDQGLRHVQCEGSKIQQVFLNIIKNATEAMVEERDTATGPDSGVVAAKAPCFVFRTRQHRNMACVEIEDNGPGMEEEVRKRIFEPFFTTKPVGIGTGLGLSVSYFIITENHGGTMEVTSQPGKGSTFIIHLPFERHWKNS